jgi:hypothetical protein
VTKTKLSSFSGFARRLDRGDPSKLGILFAGVARSIRARSQGFDPVLDAVGARTGGPGAGGGCSQTFSVAWFEIFSHPLNRSFCLSTMWKPKYGAATASAAKMRCAGGTVVLPTSGRSCAYVRALGVCASMGCTAPGRKLLPPREVLTNRRCLLSACFIEHDFPRRIKLLQQVKVPNVAGQHRTSVLSSGGE